jgi:hydrogenase/urease accessory protein HupE
MTGGAWRWAWLPVACLPLPAGAHAPLPGIKGFYIGMLHPFSTPAQMLLMLGLGLMIGLFPAPRYRWLGGAFLLTTLGGLALGACDAAPDGPLLAAAVAAAGMAALLPGRALPVAVALAALAGLLIGAAAIPEPGPERDRLVTLAGSFVGANLGLLYCAGLLIALTQRYRAAWIPIGVRVVAAWTAAISAVMLALALRA